MRRWWIVQPLDPSRATMLAEYALRHLGAHLTAADQAYKVYALARNSSFVQMQLDQFPEEPAVALSTLKNAVMQSLRSRDYRELLEFSVSHLRRFVAIQQQSPISTAVLEERLRRAWQLADYEPADRRGV